MNSSEKIKILLCDINPDIVDCWNELLPSIHSEKFDIEVHLCSFLALKADALVSPANSFLFMNGGIDYPIREYINSQAENVDIVAQIQKTIRNSEVYNGEVLVGDALITKIKTENYSYLISAPTMRVPGDISYTSNVFLSIRATLSKILLHNKAYGILNDHPIKSVLIPGMGTGVGGVTPESCALQTKTAIEFFNKPSFPETLQDAAGEHYIMFRTLTDLND
jgi:O-acetyl-ADP-ribose deacetylase (regulator of RNase III)